MGFHDVNWDGCFYGLLAIATMFGLALVSLALVIKTILWLLG